MNRINNTIKYFIYARKSSESDERQIQSIDDQVKIMKGLAKDFDLTVVDIFTESKSAKEPHGRMIFEQMLKRIQNGEAEGILTWKVDRLSRNPIDGARIQWLLQKEVIKSIQTVGREYASEDNALIFSVETSMANQYIRDLSKNVKRGLQSKLEKGWMPGIAPLGYLNTKSEARGENYIIKDPERFPLIRKAWDLMLTGNYRPDNVLGKLNNEWGFRTRGWKKKGKKPLSRGGIYRIFANPFYAGIIPYKQYYKEGKHPAMITVDEFDKVQFLLKRKGNPKYSHHQYAYTGLIKCGECGGVVSATFKQKLIKKTGELKSYALYYCVNARKKRLACSQSNYTNVEQIEDKIEEFTTSLVMIPGFQELALEMLEQEKGKEKDDTKTILETQQKTLFNIEKQLTNLTQLRIREMISDEEFIKEKTRLQNEQVRLQTQLNQTEKTTINWVELTAKTFEFASYAHKAFLRGSAEIKKSILSAFSLNCTLKDKIFSFEALEWFLPIQEFNKTIDAQIGPFEPEINLYTVRQKEILLSFSPQLRGLVYTVGTKLVSYKKQNEKFSIPDLKDNHDPP